MIINFENSIFKTPKNENFCLFFDLSNLINFDEFIFTGQLEAIYENDQEIKLFHIGKPLSLVCKAADTTKIVW